MRYTERYTDENEKEYDLWNKAVNGTISPEAIPFE
jgi:hypothetical protein